MPRSDKHQINFYFTFTQILLSLYKKGEVLFHVKSTYLLKFTVAYLEVMINIWLQKWMVSYGRL